MFSRPPLPKRFVNPCLPSGASFPALSAVFRRVLVIASSQHLPARKLGALARSLGIRAWEEPGRGGPPSREKREGRVGGRLVYFLPSVAPKRSLDLGLKKRCLDAGKSFSISSGHSAVLAGWPQGGLAPLSLRVWASEGAPCLAQAPQKEKAESASAVAGAGRVSQHFLLSSPRAGARSAAAGKASAPPPPPPPGTPELTAACPLTQLPPTRAGEGVGRGRGLV